jgi:hypothetical protein
MGIIPDFSTLGNRLGRFLGRQTEAPSPEVVAWRQDYTLAQVLNPATPTPAFVAQCALATRYREMLHPLPWEDLPKRALLRATTQTPYLFFFLCGIEAGYTSHAKLARFLREHPSLLWLAGLRLHPDSTFPCGFDPARATPRDDRLRAVLRDLDSAQLDWLLAASVRLFQNVPQFAHTVAGDTKHILAWVKENNPKCAGDARFDKTCQPRGDPDCKLGVKSRRNRSPTPTREGLPASTTPKTVADQSYWGYGSGVVATPLPQGMGQVVLAEHTQTFDQSDISYFLPLMHKVVATLGSHPPFGAWDAAFDAFYVYDAFHAAGGFAAVPLNLHGQPTPKHTHKGVPLCPTDRPMRPTFDYLDRSGLVAQTKTRFTCPLLQPLPIPQSCTHPMFAKGGCTANRGTSPGARIRYTLARESTDYKRLYAQRTCVERVNAQALALGIERPHLRNARSISHRNTLIYVLLNLQTFQRLKARAPEMLNTS